ncbi:MAG TPA: hypothetical protein PLA14_05680, partial [Ferruginibacter sp.]|nr:hypothetical protein [Ferruginibacter sp.]
MIIAASLHQKLIDRQYQSIQDPGKANCTNIQLKNQIQYQSTSLFFFVNYEKENLKSIIVKA